MNVRSEIFTSPNVSHKTFERWLFKSIEDGRELITGNLFEEDLYRRRGVACRFEDRCREEHLSDPLADRLRRVGDMISFYRTRPVRDDDVDFVSANDELVDRESEGPADVCEDHLLKERLRVILSSLQDLERQVIDFRFGLSDGYSRTLEEVGRLFDMTREDICIVEIFALRKLRHPSRMRSLGDYRNS